MLLRIYTHHFCQISNFDTKHSSNCQTSQCCKVAQDHLPLLAVDLRTPPGGTSWPRYSIRELYIHGFIKSICKQKALSCKFLSYWEYAAHDIWPHAISRYVETLVNEREYRLSWELTDSWSTSTYCTKASSCVGKPRCSQNTKILLLAQFSMHASWTAIYVLSMHLCFL